MIVVADTVYTPIRQVKDKTLRPIQWIAPLGLHQLAVVPGTRMFWVLWVAGLVLHGSNLSGFHDSMDAWSKSRSGEFEGWNYNLELFAG